MIRRLTSILIIFYLLLLQGGFFALAAVPETIGGVTIYSCDSPEDIFNPADPTGQTMAGPAAPLSGGFYCLVSMAYKLFFSILSLVGIGIFVMLLVGGLKYITAGGDEKSLMSARKTITYGFMGLGIVVASIFLFIVLNNIILKPGVGPSPFQFLVPDWVCTEFGQTALGGICSFK